jgi:hypothetical protein
LKTQFAIPVRQDADFDYESEDEDDEDDESTGSRRDSGRRNSERQAAKRRAIRRAISGPNPLQRGATVDEAFDNDGSNDIEVEPASDFGESTAGLARSKTDARFSAVVNKVMGNAEEDAARSVASSFPMTPEMVHQRISASADMMTNFEMPTASSGSNSAPENEFLSQHSDTMSGPPHSQYQQQYHGYPQMQASSNLNAEAPAFTPGAFIMDGNNNTVIAQPEQQQMQQVFQSGMQKFLLVPIIENQQQVPIIENQQVSWGDSNDVPQMRNGGEQEGATFDDHQIQQEISQMQRNLRMSMNQQQRNNFDDNHMGAIPLVLPPVGESSHRVSCATPWNLSGLSARNSVISDYRADRDPMDMARISTSGASWGRPNASLRRKPDYSLLSPSNDNSTNHHLQNEDDSHLSSVEVDKENVAPVRNPRDSGVLTAFMQKSENGNEKNAEAVAEEGATNNEEQAADNKGTAPATQDEEDGAKKELTSKEKKKMKVSNRNFFEPPADLRVGKEQYSPVGDKDLSAEFPVGSFVQMHGVQEIEDGLPVTVVGHVPGGVVIEFHESGEHLQLNENHVTAFTFWDQGLPEKWTQVGDDWPLPPGLEEMPYNQKATEQKYMRLVRKKQDTPVQHSPIIPPQRLSKACTV